MAASWRQLAAIPESLLKDSIIRALGVEIPPEGISHKWNDRGLYIEYCSNPQGVSWFVVYDAEHPDPAIKSSPQMCMTPNATAKAIRWPAGTPTGDAIRRWLLNFGYVPPGSKPKEPQENTRTII
jgi:hypothetical protein